MRGVMFLRHTKRKKDGKEHRYWSIVENRRVGGGRVVQRPLLYLGEINDSQELAWRKSIAVLEEGAAAPRPLSLFPEDRCEGVLPDAAVVRLKLAELRLCRPRQWGGCWLAVDLWRELALAGFWAARLGPSRKGTRWHQVLLLLATYRLLAPGSEWRLHRQWFEGSAMADLLGEDVGLAEIHLLYDLTSTYFESDPPFPEGDKRRHGYSRDHRGDCVQVIIALVVTPEGLPLAYEVLPGNTADNTTLKDFLARSVAQSARARRIGLMDRGVPTEAVLAEMRAADPPVQYLVGTPKGRLTRLEKGLVDKPWHDARPGVQVKLLPQDGELYVFAQSTDRVAKERAIRRRQLKWLWGRLKQLAGMKLSREELLMRLGAARKQARTAWRLIAIEVPADHAALSYRLDRAKLRRARRREGRYLLRTNLTDDDPARLWGLYLQLVSVEEAFRNLKGDLAIRPIFHQDAARIEAHIFIAFLAYCLHVTLGRRLHALAPGLTPRSAIEKFAAVQMIDLHIPTTDGRELLLTRYTEPEPELALLLDKLKFVLPAQPEPKINAAQTAPPSPV